MWKGIYMNQNIKNNYLFKYISENYILKNTESMLSYKHTWINFFL